MEPRRIERCLCWRKHQPPGVYGGYFSQSGHLLYFPVGSVRAVLASTFDTSSMGVGTFSIPVLSDTQSAPMAGAFSLALSRAGTMAYLAETSDMPAFQAAHRNGAVLAVEMELPGLPLWPRLSPDGTKKGSRCYHRNGKPAT